MYFIYDHVVPGFLILYSDFFCIMPSFRGRTTRELEI